MAELKVTPFLWFKGDVEKVAKFYLSVFGKKNVKITDSNPMSVSMRIMGQNLIAFAGGPHYEFSPAISFMVSCKTQKEVDRYWNGLLRGGGKPNRCGWLRDRFGLSWQIVPEVLPELLFGKDEEGAGRAHEAMMKMRKLDIAKLKKAYAGR
jgi:predicted 3-demethylubiquinone-9 3-methyltransferase (glyoxalase superfamily)